MRLGFLHRYVLSFGDQGLTALLSLCVSLWLIRRGAEGEFGAYVFWASAALAATGLATSLTSVHLHPLRPAPLAGRRNMERALLGGTLLLAGLAASGALVALPLLGAPLGLWGAVPLLPGTLIGFYARALATSRGLLGAAFFVSAAAFLSVVLGLAVVAALGLPPQANHVLALSGLAQGLAGAAVLARLGAGQGWGLACRRWPVLLRRSLWPLAGAVAWEVSTRLYVFLVAAMAGTLAMAALAAAQTLLRPATLLAGAWAGAARSALALRHHARDQAGFARIVAIGALGPALATCMLGVTLAWFWPLVSALAFGGRYAELAGTVLLWTANMTLACFVFAFGVALQAMGRLRDAARGDIASALVVGLTMAPLLAWLPPVSALLAILLGALAQLAVQAAVLRRAWPGVPLPGVEHRG